MAPAGLVLAGENVNGDFLRGLMVFGVPVGTDQYVRFKLNEVADQIISDAKKVQEVLASERQAPWSALRLSISSRFGYFQQNVHPSLCEPVSARLDAALWQSLEAGADFKIPRGREPGGLPLEIPAVPLLHVLNKVLEAVRPKSTRAAWAWKQQDKVSSAWLLCLPGVSINRYNSRTLL